MIKPKEKPRAYETFKIYNLMIIFKNGTESKYGSFLSLDDAESCQLWVKLEGFGADNAKVESKIETQLVRLPLVHEKHPIWNKIKEEQIKAEEKAAARGY